MANVTLTVVDARRSSSGQNVTDNDTTVGAVDTYFFDYNGRVILVITNAAGSNTVTVATPGTVDGLAVTDNVNALVAAKHYVFGPFPPALYNDSQGRLKVTVSANTNLFAVRV